MRIMLLVAAAMVAVVMSITLLIAITTAVSWATAMFAILPAIAFHMGFGF